ncbi:putative DNA-binding protein (MmcQ/YjbR family) [Pedobacter sp. UYP30]|uniref:MmcQ/YjbR family DNA-binding protein n=1 Tax=Pedobacter sp. UYP30 TaxID=1756400 RepID=UPI0033920EA8
MPQVKHFKNIANSFESVIEDTQAEKTSFKVEDKIFATLNTQNFKAILRLSTENQIKYSDLDPSAIYAAPAGWGKQGWTIFELKFVEEVLINKALTQSYCEVAPKQLADKYVAEH